MSLVADYGSSNSSSSSDNEEDFVKNTGLVPKEEHDATKISTTKLPRPECFDSNGVSSVFKNPFREEEKAKTAILEKHVKMVDTQEHVKVINGKKICWNYRKGRCRFGHNCKYAHDSDIQKTTEELEKEKKVQQVVVCENKQISHPTVEELQQIQSEAINKKKRPGLSQGIVPSKKVMKMYYNTKTS